VLTDAPCENPTMVAEPREGSPDPVPLTTSPHWQIVTLPPGGGVPPVPFPGKVKLHLPGKP
jgi:hypothetical protein